MAQLHTGGSSTSLTFDFDSRPGSPFAPDEPQGAASPHLSPLHSPTAAEHSLLSPRQALKFLPPPLPNTASPSPPPPPQSPHANNSSSSSSSSVSATATPATTAAAATSPATRASATTTPSATSASPTLVADGAQITKVRSKKKWRASGTFTPDGAERPFTSSPSSASPSPSRSRTTSSAFFRFFSRSQTGASTTATSAPASTTAASVVPATASSSDAARRTQSMSAKTRTKRTDSDASCSSQPIWIHFPNELERDAEQSSYDFSTFDCSDTETDGADRYLAPSLPPSPTTFPALRVPLL